MVSSFCNSDHRRRKGSGRAHRAKAEGGGQRPSQHPTPPPEAAAGRPKPEERTPTADRDRAQGEPGAPTRGAEREQPARAPRRAGTAYPVPPPAGWITAAVAGSSAAAGAMAATRIAMPYIMPLGGSMCPAALSAYLMAFSTAAGVVP